MLSHLVLGYVILCFIFRCHIVIVTSLHVENACYLYTNILLFGVDILCILK